ncbi:MAG: HNH endonuclease signature motif containing protein, partial [Mycobacterium sp.]
MRTYEKTGECIIWNGIPFYRYPDSPVTAHQRYYSPHIGYRRKGVESLHREIWKAAHGPIPKGHEIHHTDHDWNNNEPANLVCLPGEDHRQHHRETSTANGSAAQ